VTARPHKVICISLYAEDLRAMDRMVDLLKNRGLGRANRSSLIRYAVEHVQLGEFEAELRKTRA